jgi:hypothetical protein
MPNTDNHGKGLNELDDGRISDRLMRNETELAIVMVFKIFVMMEGRNNSADRNYLCNDCGGKNAEKQRMSKELHGWTRYKFM